MRAYRREKYMQKARTVNLILLLLICSVSFAQGASKENKLRKLAKHENVLSVVERYRTLCIEENKKMNPEKIISENPMYFGGITPESKYWGEVNSIFQHIFCLHAHI